MFNLSFELRSFLDSKQCNCTGDNRSEFDTLPRYENLSCRRSALLPTRSTVASSIGKVCFGAAIRKYLNWAAVHLVGEFVPRMFLAPFEASSNEFSKTVIGILVYCSLENRIIKPIMF